MTTSAEPCPLEGLREITDDLSAALSRFRVETRLEELARKNVPDARHRLEHVLRMTDSAAHRTLDLVEQAFPLADRIARRAAVLAGARGTDGPSSEPALAEFLTDTCTDAGQLRQRLSEVLLAQGYQDLTGQIIRGVLGLVADVESTLQRLVALSPAQSADLVEAGSSGPHASRPASAAGFGPAVPRVDAGPLVEWQSEADALLQEFGR